jgi:SAM-dependent methyltransferase
VSTTDETSLDERLFAATVGALELFGVYLGDRLGLYDALRDGRAVTPGELADACGIHPRYAREWLEQQAVAGVLAVDDASAVADARRYRLPAGHAGVLTDATDGAHVAPFARMVVGIANAMEDVSRRTAPAAASLLPLRRGLPPRPGLDQPAGVHHRARGRLAPGDARRHRPATRGRPRRIAVARAFPDAEVWAFDRDAASIEEARGHAEGAGARVRFEVADATSLDSSGPFDLVMLLEVLHDLARPVEVLAAARAALADGGAVLVADEAVAPAFTAPGDDLERMMDGWSVAHCLPSSMAEQPSAAIGTAIREDTVRELAPEAGFGRVDVLDADGGFFRLYELRD